MKKLIISMISVLMTLCSPAQSHIATLDLPNRSGEFDGNRVSYIEYSAPKETSNLPVLLLGPGVNRGLLASDSFIRAITNKGYGYVAMHFSTLPHSVAALRADKVPFFKNHDFKMEDYAFEIEAVANWSRQEFKRDIVPVTLSFSGAASSLLSSFELIIDIAPMTSLSAARPSLGFYLQTLRTANYFNPFSAAVIRTAMDQSYYSVWRPKTQDMILDLGLGISSYESILAGYMTSSQVLEDFQWNVSQTPASTKRVMILAEYESRSLLRGQIQTLEDQFEAQKNTLCFNIRGADHAISFSKPELTATIIDQIIHNKFIQKPGCFDISEQEEVDFIPIDELNFTLL